MVSYLLSFIGAFAGTWLMAWFAEIGLIFFGIERRARFGALCIAAGFVFGRYSGSGPVGPEALRLLSGLSGGVLALCLLWYWLFKREERQDASRQPGRDDEEG